jgi:hypothetical protein
LEEDRNVFGILTGKPTKSRDLYEGLGIDERIILDLIFKEMDANTRNWIKSQ